MSTEDAGFVQIVATDPLHRGKGFSAALLKWQMEHHTRLYPNTPVLLDTAGQYQRRVYERIGMRELGRHHLKVNVNTYGFRPDGSRKLEYHERADSVQIVMMLDTKTM